MSLVPFFVLCDGTCAATAEAFPVQWVCLWLLTYSHYMGMWGNILLPFAHFGSRKCRLCGSIAVTLCPDRQYKTVYI